MTEKTGNAFTMVRPKGANTSPSPKLAAVNRGAEPPKIGKAALVALDRTGRRTVSLAPMPSNIHINSPKESLAMQDKERKIAGKVRGGR